LRDLQLVFHVPSMDLGFHGVPYNAYSFIVSTGRCFVEMLNPPFFVINLIEIDIMNMERVGVIPILWITKEMMSRGP